MHLALRSGLGFPGKVITLNPEHARQRSNDLHLQGGDLEGLVIFEFIVASERLPFNYHPLGRNCGAIYFLAAHWAQVDTHRNHVNSRMSGGLA